MRYRVVEQYYRQQHFDYYRRHSVPFYDVSFRLDITRLKNFADDRRYPVYPNLCYFFTRAAQQIEDFRYRFHEGRIVLYEGLHPGLTVPAPDGRFNFAYLPYDPDVEVFNRNAAPILERARKQVALEDREHRNWLYFTALPGVPFTAFTHARSTVSTDAEPKVAFGRFVEEGGRLLVPVGLQVNHVFIDGRALGQLYEGVQRQYDDPK